MFVPLLLDLERLSAPILLKCLVADTTTAAEMRSFKGSP
jgi:hypothetical protein